MRELWNPIRFGRRRKDKDGYRVYTSAFDVECDAGTLAAFMPIDIDAAAISGLEVDRLKSRFGAIEWSAGSGAAICVLVDHSGSMRKPLSEDSDTKRVVVACAIAEYLADILGASGIAHEVLGYTTASWKGGNARETWISRGRPKRPGRLCELLHIVYRRFDHVGGRPARFREMLDENILKENVDGEALLWAASRLQTEEAKRRILFVITDGAPVDDSTLHENDKYYLVKHLSETIKNLTNEGIEIVSINIGDEDYKYYDHGLTIKSTVSVGGQIADLLSDLVKKDPG